MHEQGHKEENIYKSLDKNLLHHLLKANEFLASNPIRENLLVVKANKKLHQHN